MVSTSTRLTPRERVATRKLMWVGPLTIVVVVLLNLVVRTLAINFFGVAASFLYLQIPVVIGSTVSFLLLALLAFVLVGRFSRQPIRNFWIVAGAALLVSFLNPFLLLEGEVFVLQQNRDRRENAFFRHSNEISSKAEGKQIEREFRRDDCFKILEFDFGWPENLRREFETVELIIS